MDSVQIIEQATNRMAVIDLESKLLQSNIIFVTQVLTQESVATYQAELFYLTSKISPQDSKTNPIKIYINSPGGDAYSYFGLYDVIQTFVSQGYIIETINIGLAASGAAFLLLAGSKGHRICTKNSTVLLHQPSSWTEGTITDMNISVEEGKRIKKILHNIIKEHASAELIPLIERDVYLSPEEALKYNIVDYVK